MMSALTLPKFMGLRPYLDALLLLSSILQYRSQSEGRDQQTACPDMRSIMSLKGLLC